MSPKTMTKSAQQTPKPSSKKNKEMDFEEGMSDESMSEPGSESKGKKSMSLRSDDSTESVEVEGTVVDPDELEEQEEAAAEASSGGGGNAAALAAASGSTEMSASFKNFRHHPDMENFYRFIYENDLRHEALAIIDEIIAEKAQRKLVKGAKTQSH